MLNFNIRDQRQHLAHRYAEVANRRLKSLTEMKSQQLLNSLTALRILNQRDMQ
jgi:hypothetical protein